MRAVVAVGFGRYFRERLFSALATSPEVSLDVRVVTSLKEGWEEFRALVEPEFTSRGLPCPEYVPDLDDAIRLVSGMDGWSAAVINTPPSMHHSAASACIAAGLDVYVERPIATHADDLMSLVVAAERSGVRLFTGSQRRLEAPYEYIHDVVTHRMDFGELAFLRCSLSVGERPASWRADRKLAGGGVLLDSGFHLLDCAAWITDDADHLFGPDSVRYAYLGGDSYASDGSGFLESVAVGHVRTNRGADLFFDVSYTTSKNAIYERFEVMDRDGARVLMMRDQASRTTDPGLVTHQRADGSIVSRTVDGRTRLMERALLSHGPGNAKPLASFLKCRDETGGPVDQHPCSGRSAITSWRLMRDIYQKGGHDRR